MNKKLLLSSIIFFLSTSLVSAQGTGPVKKPKSLVAKQVQQIMNKYYRSQPLVDWEGGPPEEEELQEALRLLTDLRNQIQQLVPATSKDKKAVQKALKELNREISNLEEQLFRVTRIEPWRERVQDAHQMDEDWSDPASLRAKIAEFEKLIAEAEALKAEAGKHRKGIGGIIRELANEIKNLQERIRDMRENLDRQQEQFEQREEHERDRQQEPPAGETPPPTLLEAAAWQSFLRAQVNNTLRQRAPQRHPQKSSPRQLHVPTKQTKQASSPARRRQ